MYVYYMLCLIVLARVAVSVEPKRSSKRQEGAPETVEHAEPLIQADNDVITNRDTRSSTKAKQARNRGRVASPSQRPEDELPYFWMCPEVNCPAIPDKCETIEFFTFEYQYEVRGRLVTVRCDSCQYCLDRPFVAVKRSSTIDIDNNSCPAVAQCPALPDNCADERPTTLLVDGQPCKRCPACYDHTVVTLFNF